ncbi:hypothetical protein ACIQU6_43915 [Streptomyces sp. NPDC090442]
MARPPLENFVAADLDHLARVLKRRPKKIRYRPHLLHDCLAETCLTVNTS